MITLLVLAMIIIILLLIINLKLLFKVRLLVKKNKYAYQADMWHKLAVTDDLTGTYNRNAFNLYINDIKLDDSDKLRWLILFDVDGFKKVNDTKGHQAGDNLLKSVAQILLEIFPSPYYRVFRIGVYEFAVLGEDVKEKEFISKMIKLKKSLNAKEGISLSKGYSIIKSSLKEAFKYADEMLYADKNSNKLRNN